MALTNRQSDLLEWSYIMNWYQQGDVMLKPVEQVPAGGTRVSGAVLAEGEATGHRHVAAGDGVAVLEREGVRYLNAPSGARITHAEHKEIVIPPGQYRIDVVHEYDHFQEVASPPTERSGTEAVRTRRVPARRPAVRRVRD